jgi:hypothetical protein
MNTPIKLPNIAKSEHTGTTEYHFTLPDKTVAIKTLKEIITELGQPNLIVFEDNTFTVGRIPILYRKAEGEWIEIFRFEACQIAEVAPEIKLGEHEFTIDGKVFSTQPFANDDKGADDEL